MIYLETDDYLEWAKEHHLEPQKYVCPVCKKEFETNKPFITKYSYGLASEIHDCGKQYQLRVCVARSDLLNIELTQAFFDLKDSMQLE
jgi:hypothetical protein